MGDSTLSLTSLMSVATPLAPADPNAATALPAGSADPFAELLSSLAGNTILSTTPTAGITPMPSVPSAPDIALVPSAPPAPGMTLAPNTPLAASPVDLPIVPVAVPAMPLAPPAVPPAIATNIPAAEPSIATASSDGDEDSDTTADDTDPHGDPLADAITQGMTAVLALAQIAPPPPIATPVSTATSTPVTASVASRSTIAMVAARAAPAAAAPNQPVSQAAPPPAAPAAIATTAAPTDAAPTDLPTADAPTPVASSTGDTSPSDVSTTRATYSPAVVAALRAAVAAARPGATARTAQATAAAAPLVATPESVPAAAATTTEADDAVTAPAADPSDTPRQVDLPGHAARPMRAVGLAAHAESVAQAQRPVHTDARRLPETALPVGLAPAFADHARQTASADPTAAAATSPADAAIQQQLTIAKDGQWLDSLARDIAATGGSGGDLNFKLNPAHLGSLAVQIAQGADGASIRLTADTDTARNILVDAQPRLIAEARAQGLKVSDTQVDLSQQQSGGSAGTMRQGDASAGQNGQNRQPLPDRQPFAASTGIDPDSAESADDSNALYA